MSKGGTIIIIANDKVTPSSWRREIALKIDFMRKSHSNLTFFNVIPMNDDVIVTIGRALFVVESKGVKHFVLDRTWIKISNIYKFKNVSWSYRIDQCTIEDNWFVVNLLAFLRNWSNRHRRLWKNLQFRNICLRICRSGLPCEGYVVSLIASCSESNAVISHVSVALHSLFYSRFLSILFENESWSIFL